MNDLVKTNDTVENIEANDLPWLIFTLNSNCYAVNSKYVNGILMPPEVTPLPEASDVYKGLIEIRGEVFPLLEMRKLFRFQSIEDESKKFEEYLNKYKQAHIDWVTELKKCVENNDRFMMEKDPLKCGFGQWYYDYINKSNKQDNSVIRTLMKIEYPHKLLHETSVTIDNLISSNKGGKNDDQIKSLLSNITDNYMPIILGLMNETVESYKGQFRETVVHLSNSDESLGLLVDEVLAIDAIEMVSDDRSMNKIVDSRYFVGVAHNAKIKKEILIIDEDLLLRKAKI